MALTRDAVTAAVAGLAHAQQGAASRAQLLAAGVPGRTITDRCRTGRWQRPLPGVVVMHSGPLTWQQRYRAAVLYAAARSPAGDGQGEGRGGGMGPSGHAEVIGGPGRVVARGQGVAALITGTAALALYRLRAVTAPEGVREVDVLVPDLVCGVRSRGRVRVHRTQRMPRPVTMDGGLLVAPLPRAVADAVRAGGPEGEARTRTLLHEVVQARRVSPSALAEELRAGRLSKRDDVASVLEELNAGTRSPAEGLARRVVQGAGVVEPLWNPRLYLDGWFLAMPDGYWPDGGVLLEVDSKEHHWTVEDWERTMARHNRLAGLGLRVLHVSPAQLRREPGEVIAALRAALASGPHGPVDRIGVVQA